MAGVVIPIASETKAFKQGVETGIIKPLDKAVDALDDLGKSKGPDKLEDGLKDAQKASERLQDETKDTARLIEKEYKDSYRQLKQSADDGYSGVKESARSAKDEAIQNFGETAASFDGSMQGVADGIQGTFGGLATSLPLPLGLAAGAIGIIGGTIAQEWADNSEEMQQAAADWADAYVTAGSRVLSATQVLAKAQEIVTDPEQFKEAQDNAKEWGVSQSIALLAMSGNTDALAEATRGLAARQAELNEKTKDSTISHTSEEFIQLKLDVDNGTEALNKLKGGMEAGHQQADVYSEALRLTAETTAGATKAVDELGDTVVTLPDGKQIYIDAETGQATEDTDAIKNKIYGINNKTVVISTQLSGLDEATRRLDQLARNRTVNVDVNGNITRIGSQVW